MTWADVTWADDEGSASVWALAAGLLVLALAYAFVLVGAAIDARHRVESAADLAALAAAAAGQLGQDGCPAAARIAVANQAVLTSCTTAEDGSYTVEVTLGLPQVLARWSSGSTSALSRAGS